MFACALGMGADVRATAQPTREITSNAIYRLAGHGDTLWMATKGGLNSTVAPGATLTWWGYEARNVLVDERGGAVYAPLAFGDHRVLTCLSPEAGADASSLWTFDHRSDRFGEISLAWNRDNLADTLDPEVKGRTFFDACDVAWTPGAFWVACRDGGLVRLDTADVVPGERARATVFFPGVDSTYPIADFPPTGFVNYPDTNRQVYGVTVFADSTRRPLILATTPQRVWSFSPADTTWDTLSNKLADATGAALSRGAPQFSRVYAIADSARRWVFASLETVSGVDTTSGLYQYDFAAALWRLVRDRSALQSLAFGDNDTLYAVSDGVLSAFTLGTTLQRLDQLSTGLNTRMSGADESIVLPLVSDILFTHANNDAVSLWVATTNGLYYSRHERHDEVADTVFTRASRAPKLTAGLKQAYFVPTILTNYVEAGYFAYNLSKDADVTITVYDWNMDFVKTIVSRQPRQAGATRSEGRSTVQKYDTWDGTNRDGKPVAPGVYFYKILSSKGERAMGKIVVAR